MSGSANSIASRSSPSETLLNFQSAPQQGSTSSAAVASELTQIKIRLRGEAEKRKRSAQHSGRPSKTRRLTSNGDTADTPGGSDERQYRDVFGRDDVTVRFLWQEE
jgi:hypothetical protein